MGEIRDAEEVGGGQPPRARGQKLGNSPGTRDDKIGAQQEEPQSHITQQTSHKRFLGGKIPGGWLPLLRGEKQQRIRQNTGFI